MVAVYEKRRQSDSSDLMNFLLQMASHEERKGYREDQQARTQLAREQLNITKSAEVRAAGIYKAGAAERKGRKKLVKRFGRADKALAAAKREYAVAKTTGDVARQAETARTLSAVKALHGKSAEMFETILFADEIAKDSRAQLYLAQQQALLANQETQTTAKMFDLYKTQTSAKLNMVGNVGKMATGLGVRMTGEAIDAALAGQSATEIAKLLSTSAASEARERSELTRQGDWIDDADFTKADKEKFDPASLSEYSDAFRNTGRGVETMTIARPKDQRRFFWGDRTEMTLTRRGAIRVGAEDLYDSVKSKEVDKAKMLGADPAKIREAQRGAGRWGSMPAKRKTVKELANEKAKKTTTAGGKATQKPAGKKAVGGYTIGQVINRAGKKYRITGFDTDGEPLVVEIK